jgi:hypothetical protein
MLIGGVASELLTACVRGYHRKDGPYVQPHQRSSPDSNSFNNYGFPGNYNPNTWSITPGIHQRYLKRYYRGQNTLVGSGHTKIPVVLHIFQAAGH